MKAIKYHGVRNLELVDIKKPKAGPGQVLVKVVYCGMCGTDIHAYTTPGIFDWELILGHESVGIVEEVGEGVTYVKAGDRVAVGPPGDCGHCYACNTGHPNICANAFPNTLGIGPGTQGAYAEYVLSHYPENELFPIPEQMSWEQAVLFDVIGVGFHSVRRSELKIGDDVVVTGCGSIGLAAIQSAKLAGAKQVIAFDIVESRRKMAVQAGADVALDPRKDDDMALAHQLLAHTGGAAVSFEAAGNASGTVSYTHLDVYKRQAFMRTRRAMKKGRIFQRAALTTHFLNLRTTAIGPTIPSMTAGGGMIRCQSLITRNRRSLRIIF